MQKMYNSFIFDSYKLDTKLRRISLTYSLDDAVFFTETFDLPKDLPLAHTTRADVDRALFALHLAAGISYYKTYCPLKIEVRSGSLSAQQAAFWNEFYTRGLGEFFYQNKIDFRGLVQFPTGKSQEPLKPSDPPTPRRALVPFGGGKDSVVTVELLREHNVEQTLFRLRRHHYIDQLAVKTGLPLVTVERAFDTSVLELNKQGAYNGHVPITGIISFLTVVIALLGDYDSIWFSNERSADYGNVEYLGHTINHQWSKSLEAEELMRSYIQHFVTTNVHYLSMLRPLGELRIAQIFANYPQYFTTTTSCNVNWRLLDTTPKNNAWCGKCYKCAFIFALYAAVLPAETATTMFGKNLFEDTELLHTYRQLWGAEGIKPFDCVGTVDEMQAAMYLALKKPAYANTPIGKDFATHTLPHLPTPDNLVTEVLKPNMHGVPQHVRDMLKGVL